MASISSDGTNSNMVVTMEGDGELFINGISIGRLHGDDFKKIAEQMQRKKEIDINDLET